MNPYIRKYHFVYRTSRPDGRYYLGRHSTDDLNDGYLGSGKILCASIKKHGKDYHIREILEFLPSLADVKIREKEFVAEVLKKDPLCMNISPGGDGFDGPQLLEWWSQPEYRARTSGSISKAMIENGTSKGVKNRNITRWILQDPIGKIIEQPLNKCGREFIEDLGLSYQMLIKFRSKNLPHTGKWIGWQVVSTSRPTGQKQTRSGARRPTRCSSLSKVAEPIDLRCML